MRFLLPLLAAMAAASPAFAGQPADTPGSFERGFGMDNSSFDEPINPSTRDANGNRLIVDGRIVNGSSLIGGLTDAGFASSLSGTAVGNQLNVVTQGNWNTVIVDSTQINNGDVRAVTQGEGQ